MCFSRARRWRLRPPRRRLTKADIALIDCDFRSVAEPSIVRHVEGLTLTNVRVNGRPAASL